MIDGLAYAINYAVIGIVFAAAIIAACVGVIVLATVLYDRVHALIWRARRRSAKAAVRNPDMPIPTAHGR